MRRCPVLCHAGIYIARHHTHVVVLQRSLLARAMFIFPVHGHPFDPASSSFPFSQCLSPLRLALTLLAILLVACAIRRLPTWRMRIGAKKSVAVIVEKRSAAPSNDSEQKLPSVSTLAESLPITLSGPSAPSMRGRHVYCGGRGVGVNVTWRPEAALATKPRIEAPLPAIHESETPVSMAKMMMSRHTYRAPGSTRTPSDHRRLSPSLSRTLSMRGPRAYERRVEGW
ncbi:hypothetical protein C8R45DRAFT_421895 [Mycena sanguinolenta]|nr:hypothetical protein C8R45DRAFT_421895 [Mycena sanguinolenta]